MLYCHIREREGQCDPSAEYIQRSGLIFSRFDCAKPKNQAAWPTPSTYLLLFGKIRFVGVNQSSHDIKARVVTASCGVKVSYL